MISSRGRVSGSARAIAAPGPRPAEQLRPARCGGAAGRHAWRLAAWAWPDPPAWRFLHHLVAAIYGGCPSTLGSPHAALRLATPGRRPLTFAGPPPAGRLNRLRQEERCLGCTGGWVAPGSGYAGRHARAPVLLADHCGQRDDRRPQGRLLAFVPCERRPDRQAAPVGDRSDAESVNRASRSGSLAQWSPRGDRQCALFHLLRP